MRMMTGALLILAHTILLAVYKIGDMKPWFEWYAIALGVIGFAFLVWGFVMDLKVELWRSRRRRGGDV